MTRKEYITLVWECRKEYSFALRKKLIVRQTFCDVCLSRYRVQGHHQDCSRPLEVVWLCDACHKELHQRAGRDRIGRLRIAANGILKDMLDNGMQAGAKRDVNRYVEGRAKGECDI